VCVCVCVNCCGDCPASYTTRTRRSFLEIKYCYFILRFQKYVRNTGTTTTQPAQLFTSLNDLQCTLSLYIRGTDELNLGAVHVANAVGQAFRSRHQLPFHQCSVQQAVICSMRGSTDTQLRSAMRIRHNYILEQYAYFLLV